MSPRLARPVVSTPAERQRFNIRMGSVENGYGDVQFWTDVIPDPAGKSLSSVLPDGRHAPVLDVDNHVTQRLVNGRSEVTFYGKFRRAKLVKSLADLLRDPSLVAAETMLQLNVLESVRGLARLRRVREVTVTFSYPVEVVPSRTLGHFHLLCQTSMEWKDALWLAKLLGSAGLTDYRHADISGRGDFMYVNQPL